MGLPPFASAARRESPRLEPPGPPPYAKASRHGKPQDREDSAYTDQPATRIELDRFGRPAAEFATPEGGSEVRLADVVYHDAPGLPLWVERFDYADQNGNDWVYSGRVFGAFGGSWKTIYRTPRTSPSGWGYVGSATYRDPAGGLQRITLPLDCGDDAEDPQHASCAALSGQEAPARETQADALGRPLSVQTPDGTALFLYAAAIEEVAPPSGPPQQANVDLVFEQNAKGDLTRRSFDGDRVVAVEECTNSDGGRTSLAGVTCVGDPIRTLYGYDPRGAVSVIYDPIAVDASAWNTVRHALRYHHDALGRVIQIDDPDAGTSLTFYDLAGNVASTETAGGQVRSYSYDALGRLTGITTPQGEPDHTVDYRSDELQPGSETSAHYSRGLTYDDYGRVSKETVNGLSASYGFDLLGRRTGVGYPRVQGTRYRYEGAYLKQILCGGLNCPKDANGNLLKLVEDVTYDALGRRKTMQLPGGVRTFKYTDEQVGDDRRHLLSDTFEGSLGNAVLAYTERDPLANVLASSVRTTLEAGLDSDQVYTYDPRNRLTSWARDELVAEHFGYDALGNMTVHGSSDAGQANQEFGHPTKPHAVTKRLGTPSTDYEYTDSGNCSSAKGPGVADRFYDYDSADQLVCVSSTNAHDCDILQIFYDLRGQRVLEVSPTATRTFVGDEFVKTALPGENEFRAEVFAFGERVAYKVSSTQGPGGASAEAPPALEIPTLVLALPALAGLGWLAYLAACGGVWVRVSRRPAAAGLAGVLVVCLAVPFPVRAGGGNSSIVPVFRWVMSDPLGSGILELDETGTLVRHTRFRPFGAVDFEFTRAPTDRRYYAGHAAQQETGLLYMKARWMNPATGTFLSVDPLVADYADPQSYNAYAYARNNPISNIDPTGMFSLFGENFGFSFGFFFDSSGSHGSSVAVWPGRVEPSFGGGIAGPAVGTRPGFAATGTAREGAAPEPHPPYDLSQVDYSTPIDAEMVGHLDRLEAESVAEEGAAFPRAERGVAIRINGEVIERRGTHYRVSLPTGPETRATGHIHTPTPGNPRETRLNRHPSRADVRAARRDPYYRWHYVRGTDGRITRVRRVDQPWYIRIFTGGVERVQIRGPTE